MATAPGTEPNDTIDARSKPPFLRRVRIRGYKSIAFCDVTLEPLTILVGRNASGKSNFLDALAFLDSLMNLNIAEAIKRHGGLSSIACRSAQATEIEFVLEAEIPNRAPNLPPTSVVEYRLTLGLTDKENIEITNEELITTGGTELKPIAPSRAELHRVLLKAFKGDVQHTQDYLDSMYPTDFALAGSKRAGWSDTGFQQLLKSIGVYNFHPGVMRAPHTHFQNKLLEKSGRNLPDILRRIDNLVPNSGRRVRAYLSKITEQIVDVHPEAINEYETLRFSVKTSIGHPPLDFPAGSMSDGTLRVLAALVAVYQITPSGSAPSLVAIEEPETSLHPAAMRALVDALDEATLRTQILLTTHSAEMLDNPTIKPENIRVVQMIDGQTVIAPVDEASVEIVHRKLNTLGGLERDNLLEPDIDDLERQKRLGQVPELPT
ncbi:AAA family ATPase [Gemmata sp. G18]|uniref:AAA family ATPase n=1 Tax=Gemmata palustris TaxID=2822762 RepID=A0ABS5BXT5_9BACT|nr:AAA family ATPase [Gemmata palustris]MBP3957688.1 AAA family ATPase [Gemmata palustris]